MLSFYFVLASLCSVVLSFNCSQSPIYVDIHPRQVQGTNDFSYGSFITIGTPAQKQSLWPSLIENATTLADPAFCVNSQSVNCEDSTHGFFDSNRSSTWQNLPNFSAAFSTSSNTSISQFGSDTLHLYEHFFEDPSYPTTNTNLANFPLTTLTNYSSTKSPFFGPGGVVGLGPSSPVLDRLYTSGLVSSRSFGLYLGTGYDRAGGVLNGSLTLGGYDSGRFVEPVHNYTLTPTTASSPSELKVHVSQISLRNSTSTSTIELLTINENRDDSFDAYISTSQYPLSLPQSVTQSLASLLKASPTNTSTDTSLQLASPTNYNLTITLSDGFSITFPPSWLANVSNISPIDASPLSAPSGHNTAILGASFLTQTYLAVSYDSTPPTFYLAPALPEAPYVQTVPSCPNIAPQPAKVPHIPSFAKAGLIGAILGGIIGGSALGIFLHFCIRNMTRKKRVRFVGYDDEEKIKRQQELTKGGREAVELGNLGQSEDLESSKIKAFKGTKLSVVTNAAEIGDYGGSYEDLEGGQLSRKTPTAAKKGILKVRKGKKDEQGETRSERQQGDHRYRFWKKSAR